MRDDGSHDDKVTACCRRDDYETFRTHPLMPRRTIRTGRGKLEREVWGSAVSSPSGVWGGAAAEIEFGAF